MKLFDGQNTLAVERKENQFIVWTNVKFLDTK